MSSVSLRRRVHGLLRRSLVRSLRVSAVRVVSSQIALFALLTSSSLALSGNAMGAQKPCGAPGGPSCPPPPPIISPYQYTVYNSGGFGPWYSFSDIFTWWESFALGVSGGYCSGSLANIPENPTSPWGTMPRYSMGIVQVDSWIENISAVRVQYAGPPPQYPPSCTQNYNYPIYVLGIRSIRCPAGLQLNYQAGPPQVGPSCGPPIPPPPPPAANLEKVPGKCDPGSSTPETNSGGANSGTGRTFKGNPCDVSNGNKYHEEIDYMGAGQSPLRFVRSYNSVRAYLDSWYPRHPNDGTRAPLQIEPVGAGWSASYFQSLTFSSVSDATTTYQAVFAHRPDGRTLIFTLYNGVYVPDGDVVDTLTVTSSGYQYQTGDDTVESYDSTGRLLSVASRGQPPITVSYPPNGSSTAAFPSMVSDAYGHSISFAYQNDSA
jgi:hypothetical protein